ncbi:PREDICTED: G2/mitotic-specific cyclin-B3 [Propithecus coquereli]|uniref:G2/mitotic-specific cyclin-B3 n=1 Tax=Propithecus coquereli TaxID=379532 RepID=UPI00063FAB5A|nr:PREDICTED: G2/mitotic-specific cyclin-B3 [Propithecus coquereli]
MPLPLLPQSSKPKTKKSSSSKIVPSDHSQYEKRGENYQAKISPSSPQGALKKRSAFEDLTNICLGMNHETLYLAVKLVDHYLMEVVCKKDKLQLLGCAAFLIAAKFEEPRPPSMDDFLYVCADVYCRDEMYAMEISILQALKFDINIPVAYHFLRRYAVCIRTSMKTVTLSRFICEMTLQEYDYIQERASKLAAGSFLLALYMQKLPRWIPTLEYYSGYKASELHPLVRRLNILLTVCSRGGLNTVYSKYSHPVFFEVAKVPPVDILKLEKILDR